LKPASAAAPLAAQGQGRQAESMDGTYRIGTDHIRSIAIQCHALDVQFDRLFSCETICGYSDRI
jgi:hypothetical protein